MSRTIACLLGIALHVQPLAAQDLTQEADFIRQYCQAQFAYLGDTPLEDQEAVMGAVFAFQSEVVGAASANELCEQFSQRVATPPDAVDIEEFLEAWPLLRSTIEQTEAAADRHDDLASFLDELQVLQQEAITGAGDPEQRLMALNYLVVLEETMRFVGSRRIGDGPDSIEALSYRWKCAFGVIGGAITGGLGGAFFGGMAASVVPAIGTATGAIAGGILGAIGGGLTGAATFC
jgi:hypothetical protein